MVGIILCYMIIKKKNMLYIPKKVIYVMDT